MFEQSRILWHLTQLENKAGLTFADLYQVNGVINTVNLMYQAIKLSKMANDAKAGAIYLGITIDQFSTLDKAPPDFKDVARRLFRVIIRELENYKSGNPLVNSILRNEAPDVGFNAFKDFMDR